MYHIEMIYYFILDNWEKIQSQYIRIPSAIRDLTYFVLSYQTWFLTNFQFVTLKEFQRDWKQYISSYKHEIPVAGAIILKQHQGTVFFLSVLGQSSGKWGVPKGKLNHKEGWLQGAQREVCEEIGWNAWSLFTEMSPSWPEKEFTGQETTLPLEAHHYIHLATTAQQKAPIRFYLVDYNHVMDKVSNSASVHSRLFSEFCLDTKEIAEVAWMPWKTIRTNKKCLWVLRHNFLFLSKAVSIFLS